MRETPERQVVKRKGLIESKSVTSGLKQPCVSQGWGDGAAAAYKSEISRVLFHLTAIINWNQSIVEIL